MSKELTLEDFSGWDNDIDFMSEEIEIGDKDKDKDKDKGKDKDKDKDIETEDPEKNKDTEDVWFEETENDSEEEKDEVNNTNEVRTTLKVLKDKGFLDEDFDLEDKDIDEESILEDIFENNIEQKLDDLFKNLPEELVALNKVAMKGGNIYSVLQSFSNNILESDLDITDEKNQEKIMKYILSKKGYDNEYIESQLDFLKSTNRLKNTSEKEYSLYQQNLKDIAKNKLKETEDLEKNRKEAERKIKTTYTNFLEKKEIGQIPINQKTKTSVLEYLTDKNFKLNNQPISTFFKDVLEVIKDPEKAVQLALLFKNRDKEGNFNFDFIKNKINTKQIDNIIEKSKDKKIETSISGSSQKSLIDYF